MPPKPTCNPSLFSGANCQDQWSIYNQAAHSGGVATEGTPSIRFQVGSGFLAYHADALVALQTKFDSATAVREAEAAAHTEGFQQGAGVGVGATLLLFGLIFGIRRLTRNVTATVTQKFQARAVSLRTANGPSGR
jgi:hypothetical protein